MVAAESRFEIPERDEIFLVSLRKYNLDPGRPWWEQLWFRWAYLPIVRFSCKYMHIAGPAETEKDGKIVIIEQQGVYLDEAEAMASCENEFWIVKTLPLNVALPKETFQYKAPRAPRSIQPDRYLRRTHPSTIANRSQLNEIKASFENISRTATG